MTTVINGRNSNEMQVPALDQSPSDETEMLKHCKEERDKKKRELCPDGT